jgi:hypothetical protein
MLTAPMFLRCFPGSNIFFSPNVRRCFYDADVYDADVSERIHILSHAYNQYKIIYEDYPRVEKVLPRSTYHDYVVVHRTSPKSKVNFPEVLNIRLASPELDFRTVLVDFPNVLEGTNSDNYGLIQPLLDFTGHPGPTCGVHFGDFKWTFVTSIGMDV